jgi:hypothetical protein
MAAEVAEGWPDLETRRTFPSLRLRCAPTLLELALHLVVARSSPAERADQRNG